MNILKISGGKVELRKDNGSLIRTIVSSNAISADINTVQDKILITYLSGKVELRKENASLIRTIASSKAIDARFNGTDIAVRLSNGKTELRKENGSLIRTF